MDRIEALRAFVGIVELGSFTAAAGELGVQQTTVSRWIAALEDELGVRLLDRTTRAVRPTDAGDRFYARASEVLAAWASATDAVLDGDDALRGRLRVSVPVVFGARYVTPWLPGFLDAHPALSLEVRYADRYVDLVGEGVDVAIRVGRPVDSDYRARQLLETPRRLVASPDYVARHGAPETPSALAAHACLRHTLHDPRTTWVFTRQGRTTTVDVSGRFGADHSEALLELALRGHGVALLASWLVDDALADGRLVELLADHTAPRAPVQALYASPRYVPLAARAFVDALGVHLRARIRPR